MSIPRSAIFFAVCLGVTSASPAVAQDYAAAIVAMAMWEEFDVPQATMENVTTPPDVDCRAVSGRFECEGTHSTGNVTICRGVTIAYGAGVVYAMVKKGQQFEARFNIRCARHRTQMTFVPGGRTTIVEYDRSSGKVLYRNSIKS